MQAKRGERKTNWLHAEVWCQTSEGSCLLRYCMKDHGNRGPGGRGEVCSPSLRLHDRGNR